MLPRSNELRLRRIAVTGAILAVIAFAAPHAPVAGDYESHRLHEDHAAGMPMTEEAMERWVREYYEVHPETGRYQVNGTPVDTFIVTGTNLLFNSDGSTQTAIDTVKIMVGESVAWRRISGTHTATSGESSADPQAGALFDVPLQANPSFFEFTYTSAGLYPFFCRPHEGFNMKGFVDVKSNVGVTPLPGREGQLGFATRPSPNPTRASLSFRFALSEGGRASARVFDARGRLVADLVDDVLEPGTYGAVWDGRDRMGNRAAPGVYFVDLALPRFRESRRVVVAR
jgi:plastocyanin